MRRLLNSGKLPEDAQGKLWETLRELEAELRRRREKERERRRAIKYRRARFFERKKIERNLFPLRERARRRQLTEQEQERKGRLERQLIYVRHYPRDRKYVALFREPDDPELAQKERQKRQEMWDVILEQLAAKETAPEEREIETSHSREEGNERGASQPSEIEQEDDFFLNPEHQQEEVKAVKASNDQEQRQDAREGKKHGKRKSSKRKASKNENKSKNKKMTDGDKRVVAYREDGRVEKKPIRPRKEGGRKRVKRGKNRRASGGN